MTWAEIGGEMNLDRRTVSRKYYKYLKDAHNAHSTCDIIQIWKYDYQYDKEKGIKKKGA